MRTLLKLYVILKIPRRLDLNIGFTFMLNSLSNILRSAYATLLKDGRQEIERISSQSKLFPEFIPHSIVIQIIALTMLTASKALKAEQLQQ